jgi:NAD(P)H-dependent FMN reductase
VKILAIAGSIRAASSNAALVRAIAALAPDGITVDVYDGLGRLPHFSPDIDGDEPPVSVADLRARIQSADAVLICTPEYAYGMPGVLKNALDWLVSSGDLYRKPVAALSASPLPEGGARALVWLRQTLTALDAAVPEAASFPIPFVGRKLDGDRLSNAETVEQLRGALIALEHLVDTV